MARPEQLARLPNLLASLRDKVDTNLGSRETLSLIAAALDDERPVQFSGLPLDPPRKEQGELRQLAKSMPRPFWLAPARPKTDASQPDNESNAAQSSGGN
jgi:hypothetical protein